MQIHLSALAELEFCAVILYRGWRGGGCSSALCCCPAQHAVLVPEQWLEGVCFCVFSRLQQSEQGYSASIWKHQLPLVKYEVDLWFLASFLGARHCFLFFFPLLVMDVSFLGFWPSTEVSFLRFHSCVFTFTWEWGCVAQGRTVGWMMHSLHNARSGIK